MIGASRILLSNGRYANISDIESGSSVMSMYGKPTIVRNVAKITVDNGPTRIVLRNANYDKPFMCKDDQELLIWDDVRRKPMWVLADYFEDGLDHYVITPPKFDWQMKSVPDNVEDFYEYGHSMGELLLSNTLFTIPFYSRPDYMNGLHDTLLTGSNTFLEQREIVDIMYWISMTQTRPHKQGQLVLRSMGKPFLASRISLYKYDRKPDTLYSLHVDCQSGSYIANNIVVRV